MRTGAAIGTVALVVALVAGCSGSGSGSKAPQTGTVSGRLGIDQGLSARGLTPRVGTVTATPVAGGKPITVKTDAHGAYVLHLPVGEYKLTSHIGSKECFSANISPIHIHPDTAIADDVGCAS